MTCILKLWDVGKDRIPDSTLNIRTSYQSDYNDHQGSKGVRSPLVVLSLQLNILNYFMSFMWHSFLSNLTL